MRAEAGGPLGFPLGLELAWREGIKAVIGGDVTAVGSSVVIAARIVSAASGEVLDGLRETARDQGESIGAVDRVSKQLRRRIGESVRGLDGGAPLERATTASLEATMTGAAARAQATLDERTRVLTAGGRIGVAVLGGDARLPDATEVRARALRAAGRPADAVAALRAPPQRGTEFWLLPELGAAYDGAGQPDSAIAVYERFLIARWLRRIDADGWQRPCILFRLDELYEQRGDQARAADYYSQFAELWRGADPDLQPRVAEARRRLAALTAEPGRP